MTALLLCLIPMLQVSSQEEHDGLASGGYNSPNQVWQRLGARMVVVELAVVVVLLSGASLLGLDVRGRRH